jgi:hypothetical protein
MKWWELVNEETTVRVEELRGDQQTYREVSRYRYDMMTNTLTLVCVIEEEETE